MNPDKVIQAGQNLQREISKLIQSFEQETQFEVDCIDISGANVFITISKKASGNYIGLMQRLADPSDAKGFNRAGEFLKELDAPALEGYGSAVESLLGEGGIE